MYKYLKFLSIFWLIELTVSQFQCPNNVQFESIVACDPEGINACSMGFRCRPASAGGSTPVVPVNTTGQPMGEIRYLCCSSANMTISQCKWWNPKIHVYLLFRFHWIRCQPHRGPNCSIGGFERGRDEGCPNIPVGFHRHHRIRFCPEHRNNIPESYVTRSWKLYSFGYCSLWISAPGRWLPTFFGCHRFGYPIRFFFISGEVLRSLVD